MPKKILLDTDIGSDIDDAVCLAYLLAQTEAELLGITTVTGEGEKRARLASALCEVAKCNLPIHPGAEIPLLIENKQPTAPQAVRLKSWKHNIGFAKGEAIEFMRHTIRDHPGQITLLAIGPLTNIALLFATDPEIPSLLKELVLMSGQFMGDDRIAEWNVRVDPHASAMVYRAAGARTKAIGLDVTTKVRMSADDVRDRFKKHDLLRPVLDFAEVWFEKAEQITFHDPLAAAAIFNDDICTFERGTVEIDYESTDAAGRAMWQPDAAKGPHQVATGVNSDLFFEHFFGVFDQ